MTDKVVGNICQFFTWYYANTRCDHQIESTVSRPVAPYPQTSHKGSDPKRKHHGQRRSCLLRGMQKPNNHGSGYGSGSHSILPATLRTWKASEPGVASSAAQWAKTKKKVILLHDLWSGIFSWPGECFLTRGRCPEGQKASRAGIVF